MVTVVSVLQESVALKHLGELYLQESLAPVQMDPAVCAVCTAAVVKCQEFLAC